MLVRGFNFKKIVFLFSFLIGSSQTLAFNNHGYIDDLSVRSNACIIDGVAKVPKNCSTPYFLHLNDGDEVTLATNGPLKILARCTMNTFDEDNQEYRDRVEVLVTSSIDGWLEEDNSSTIQDAGEEILVMSESATTGTERYDNDIDEGSAIAPGGYYIGFDGESTGLGLNILEHDCTLVGSVVLIKKKNKRY